MANHMAEVENILEINMNEEFGCYSNDFVYCLTNNGLICNGVSDSSSLAMFLNGELIIKRKPCKPSYKNKFWVVKCNGTCDYRYSDETIDMINLYKLGNCYRTREEAEANRDKWVKFYDSDEVLEV